MVHNIMDWGVISAKQGDINSRISGPQIKYGNGILNQIRQVLQTKVLNCFSLFLDQAKLVGQQSQFLAPLRPHLTQPTMGSLYPSSQILQVIKMRAEKEREKGYHIPFRNHSITKRQEITRVVEEKRTPMVCWWECKLVQPLQKTMEKFLKILKQDLAIPLQGIYSKAMQTGS